MSQRTGYILENGGFSAPPELADLLCLFGPLGDCHDSHIFRLLLDVVRHDCVTLLVTMFAAAPSSRPCRNTRRSASALLAWFTDMYTDSSTSRGTVPRSRSSASLNPTRRLLSQAAARYGFDRALLFADLEDMLAESPSAGRAGLHATPTITGGWWRSAPGTAFPS